MTILETYDVVIVGAGPAGMSAAIYALRGNLKVLLLDKSAPGGKVVTTSEIQNWPGIFSIDGPTLAYQMFEQVTQLGVVYKYGTVIDIQIRKKEKIVITDDNKYKCKSVIIAGGSQYRKLEIENNERFEGNGISYCAICDAHFYKNKLVAVIGGGDSAFKEALYLSTYAKEVYLIHRNTSFRASEEKINQVLNTENIILHTPYIVTKCNGDDKIQSIEIQNQMNQKKEVLPVDGVFPFLGSIPATNYLKKYSILNDAGYIIVNENMETNIPGIFAAGDIIQKNLRQIITACNDGAIAGQNAITYIQNLN